MQSINLDVIAREFKNEYEVLSEIRKLRLEKEELLHEKEILLEAVKYYDSFEKMTYGNDDNNFARIALRKINL